MNTHFNLFRVVVYMLVLSYASLSVTVCTENMLKVSHFRHYMAPSSSVIFIMSPHILPEYTYMTLSFVMSYRHSLTTLAHCSYIWVSEHLLCCDQQSFTFNKSLSVIVALCLLVRESAIKDIHRSSVLRVPAGRSPPNTIWNVSVETVCESATMECHMMWVFQDYL